LNYAKAPPPSHRLDKHATRAAATPPAQTSDNAGMNRSILVRSALLQTLLVGVLSTALAIALGTRFFTHWGWIVGPAAWIACSLATARVLSLATRRTLLGAILAGLPSIVAVAVGLHWLGDVLAIALFAIWCGWAQPLPGAAWGV
jgi:Na+/H+-dicarboxylate symporter